MKFSGEIVRGSIVKRYKRFLADVILENDQEITSHIANTGSMKTCWEPGQKVILSFHNNPKRKLKHSLELIHNGKCWIGINTSLTNKIVKEALEKRRIKELSHFDQIKPEAKIGKSRIDFLLTDSSSSKECYVEVKNVTMRSEDGRAIFPDSVSERGQKHLKELISLKEQGVEACMLYLVQRSDISTFSPAIDIDPVYSSLLKEAHEKGVKILCYQSKISEKEIFLDKAVKLNLL